MSLFLIASPNRSAFLGEPITEDRTKILFQFDASLTEAFTKTAEVTDHPVESGADISDHIRRLPEEVEIHGWVSDNPILALASLRSGPSPRTLAKDAYDELRRIMDEGQLVRIVTELRDFDNMALTSIGVTRDKDSGTILDATIRLREVIIATTETVEPPEPVAAKKNRSKKTNRGKQIAKPPEASLAAKLSGAIFGG